MPKKILIVDDEELLTRSFTRLLAKQGYDVSTARNGADAVRLAENTPFDLVVSDIRMPGENGVETVLKIQARAEQSGRVRPPVIFITGFADEATEQEASRLKPAAYLMKPFDIAELVQLVQKTLAG